MINCNLSYTFIQEHFFKDLLLILKFNLYGHLGSHAVTYMHKIKVLFFTFLCEIYFHQKIVIMI